MVARADPREVRHVEDRVRLHTAANAAYPPEGGPAVGSVMKADNAERFERLLAAAKELGMNPAMKGSAAFFGIATIFHPPFLPTDPWESSDSPSTRRRPK